MRFLLLLAGATAATAATAAYVPGKVFDRFITIWLENQDFSAVSQDGDVLDLTKEGILLTSYYGLTHPSQPNYIASIGGDYFGLNHDGFVQIPGNVSNLVDLLDARRISWKGYFEGIPGPGYMGEGSTSADGSGWDYVRKHNPFVSFDNISHNGTRLARLQSFDDFASDVEADTLPQYAHLSPDMLNDGHNTTLAYATNWTQSFLGPLLANEKLMDRTLILLTYDESATYPLPNRIVSLLLGGAVPEQLKGTTDDMVYTHYSILSTLENNWELPTLGRYDVGANVFSVVASQTGYANHPPANLASINNSLSYAGFLNADPDLYKPVPPPNLKLVGAGGKPPERMVVLQWVKSEAELSPYDGTGFLYDGGNGTDAPNAPQYRPQGPTMSYGETAER
ncbi:phosphoesterase [Drepanopeziza brunnea f. sp. 'multigermtubi' MB_m1]|uniref:Phosphoesterase n=2 Tax=Drepanopeziza brunnea f. sp. 'multigermtubi' TaxID=698441 RepID=K1WNZ8_MARBU|nr:phosphoesterase [Drepanopeziza brunnea f. sp. 'multigermtubi' MB_m1]EKD19405.1 phosphoesterase [Drepanopeziza brunnea f. sp. 'multigermtubi' MB_m1]